MDIVLCVTGSIAATETIKLARELKRQGHVVKAFMSEEACKIIHPNALEFATGQSVVIDLTGQIEHVRYSQVDLILVAPATANSISKFAYRIADNPISTLLITAYGHDTPIVFVPSMHDSMYDAVSENVEKLKADGITFVNPRMDEGKAKFPAIEDIVLESVRAVNLDKARKGEENKIDPIRIISNKSSGRMGLELAKEAFIRGAELTVLAAKHDVHLPKAFNVIEAESNSLMREEIDLRTPSSDIFIATAAISDFAPIKREDSKISSSFDLSLDFKPVGKIIQNIKKINPDIFLVGFKAEFDISREEMINLAKTQMRDAGTDLVVANDVGRKGCEFGSSTNEVILVSDEVKDIPLNTKAEIAKAVDIPLNTKAEIAKAVFDEIENKI